MTSLRLAASRTALAAVGLAFLLGLGAQPSVAGQASALFQVTVDLMTNDSVPPGIACRNDASGSLECSPRPVVAGATNSDTRVIVYGSSLIEDDGHMWGAVAASRRVTWAGRDYLELTLSW